MAPVKDAVAKDLTMGDAAVDGLLAGLGAGIVMAVYLVAAAAIGDDSPATVLSWFDPSAAASPLTGALMHLAVAGVYGVLFGIGFGFVRRWNIPSWFAGLTYGIALFAFAQLFILPSSHLPIGGISVEHFAISHLIYGLVLGLGVYRLRPSPRIG